MNQEQWDAASFEERCAQLRRGFPFDYLLNPKPFMDAARQSYEQLPANVKVGIA